ncbi:hypothetical protein C7974DRAFT_455777, partial [Boeremia exigua]|uniref:uncharacterized protein n=1 Tax=Boeremia exigua TaxID=749465 RepID=UPI001E8E4518
FSSLLRHLRLQFAIPILAKLGRSNWNAAIEHRKTVVYKSRTVAAAHSLSHLVPLTGAMILLVFQWTEYWVSWAEDYSTSLQFAAKLHELVMQASIVEILLCLVRTSLIDNMVPLGALTSTIQTTQVSYLWSLDFFSLFGSPALSRWQRIVFIVAIPALISLTSLVGPSSAILMKPRPNSPLSSYKNLIHLNKSTESFYPSQIGVAEGLTVLYQSSFWDYNGRQGPMSLAYQNIPGLNRRRILRSLPFGFEFPLNQETGFVATLPTAYITGAMTYDSDLLTNGSITSVTAHPIVEAQCLTQNSSSLNASSKIRYWRNDRITVGELPAVGTFVNEVSDHMEMNNPYAIGTPSTVWFGPVWIREAPKSPGIKLYATTCTVSAYWNTGEIQYFVNGFTTIAQTKSLSIRRQLDAQPIILNFTHADTFRASRFHYLMEMFEMGRSLAQVLAVTLANLPNPDDQWHDRLQTATPNSTALYFVITNYGYGYGAKSTPVYLSMAVLTVYCAITASYMLYTLITGSASTAWNSGTELFALALQSKKPDHLGHTSVGIDSIKTFSEGVGVRVNAENELEIVFANDRDTGTRNLTKIVRNRAY